MSNKDKEVQDVQDLTLVATALEAVVGKYSPKMIHALRPLVSRLNSLGLHAQARPFIEQILDIRRQSADANLPSLSEAYDAYMRNLMATGDYAEALIVADQLLIEMGNEGRSELDQAGVQMMVAEFYGHLGDAKRAVAHVTAAIGVYEQHADKQGTLMSLLHQLQDYHEQDGDMENAVTAAEKRFAVYESVMGENATLVPELRDMVALYQRAGLTEKARAAEQRRRGLRRRMDG